MSLFWYGCCRNCSPPRFDHVLMAPFRTKTTGSSGHQPGRRSTHRLRTRTLDLTLGPVLALRAPERRDGANIVAASLHHGKSIGEIDVLDVRLRTILQHSHPHFHRTAPQSKIPHLRRLPRHRHQRWHQIRLPTLNHRLIFRRFSQFHRRTPRLPPQRQRCRKAIVQHPVQLVRHDDPILQIQRGENLRPDHHAQHQNRSFPHHRRRTSLRSPQPTPSKRT